MTTVKRRIRRPKKATKKVSKRTSKKRVTALKSKSNRHTRRNKSKHHGGVRERVSAKKALTAMRASPKPTSNTNVKRICRSSEENKMIISYINRLITEHVSKEDEDEDDDEGKLSEKPMASILRSLSRETTVNIIGTDEGTGMSYDDIFNRFKIWRKSEAARRRELRALQRAKKAGVSPSPMATSSSSMIKKTSNGPYVSDDAAYNAATTILSLQDEREIDKEIDDDAFNALRNEEECKEDYTEPTPTITTIPDGFTPVKKKKVPVSSIEFVKTPTALFGRPKKNDDDSDDGLENFMKDVEGYN